MDTTVYEYLRPHIQSGDLFAFAGTGPLSWAIQWRTKSRYSHVALAVRLHEGADRLFILHAIWRLGVVLLPASRYLSSYHGRAWWVALKPAHAPDGLRAELLRLALLELGRPYDWRGVLRFVLPFVKQASGAYYCSELAAALRQKVGLADETQLSPAQIVAQPVNEEPVPLN